MAIVAASSGRVGAQVRAEGGYRKAAHALARDVVARGAPARLHWYYGPVWRFYLLEAGPGVGRTVESLLEVVKTPPRPAFFNYAIVDLFVHFLEPGARERLQQRMASQRPLGTWRNSWATDPIRLRDMGLSWHEIAAGAKWDLGRLRVYRWPG